LKKHPKILAIALVAIACLASAAAASAATLYPDLKTLPPRSLVFDRVDVSGGDSGATGVHNVLRFSNTVWNAGDGPVVVSAHIDPSTKRGDASQRIYNSDGSFVTHPTGAQIYFHASHNHYHFEDWGIFQLWKASDYDAWLAGGSQGPEATGSKTTSCVLDEEFTSTLPGANWPGTYNFGGCNPDSQGNILEGLSVGWGDTYDYWRADQWIDLGPTQTLSDGNYVLRSIADPDNIIQESSGGSDTNREGRTVNDAIRRFTVSGGQIADTDPPTGTVTVNNVDASTTSTNVDLKVIGRDDVSGVDKFRASNDGGATWSPAMNYTTQDSTPTDVNWSLSSYGGNSNAGVKTVSVQFHDVSGKWGPTQTDTIELKSPPPVSAYAQTILNDTPVSFWRLGELSGTSVKDERNVNPGAYVNSPSLGASSLVDTDQANNAVGFNGTSNSARVPYSTSMDLTSAVSLEAWIKPSALPAAGQFASVVTHPEAYSLQFNGPRLELTIIQNGVRRRLQAPAGAVVPGSTYHVVGTDDGVTERLYLNGAEVANAPLTGGASKTSTGLYVGSWDSGQEYFNGVIDDVALYGKVLSAAQVKLHYDTGHKTQAQPPAAPSNVTATPASDKQINLTWKDNATDESSFVVERSTNASFTSPTLIDVANDRTSYSDTGLSASTQYWYRLRARNAVGYSAYSNTASASTNATAPTTPPAAPTTLVAGAASDTRIDMSWADNSTDETSFVVERSADASFATVQATTLPANTTSWSDTGRTANTTYWYRVKAVNAIGSSAYSNAASATTKPTPTGYSAAVTADTPVSYWRLGEASGTAAADARGANPGTYLGSPALGAGSLLATDSTNKAVAFDGSNDAVRVADSNSLDLTNAMTVEAWIKPNLLPASGQFASVVTKAESYSIQFNGPRLEFTVMQNGIRKRLQAPAGAVVSGQTYHVVATFNGTTQRLYLNGTEVANAALAGAATVTPSTLDIGSWDGGSELFNGVIDDVAVYNQPLTAARVGAHYSAGRGSASTAPPAAPSNLVAGAVSDTRVDLSWTDASADETSFVVERSSSSSFATVQATSLPANATSWSDTGRSANTTYWYRVKAVNANGSSLYSNSASATTKPVAAGYASAVTADGPVSYWRLGETAGTAAADQRSANPGTYRGSPGLGSASLVASDTSDRAVTFDGADDTVDVPDSNSLDLTTGLTIEAWIKPSLLPAAGQFASVVTKAESYSIQFNGPRLELTVMQNGVRQRLQAPAGAVVSGQTYHVVGTYDGTTQRLYLNGAQVASAPLTGAATVTPSTLDIGSWDGSGEKFSGVVDEVALYSQALSATRVSSHYSAGQGSAPAAAPAAAPVSAAAPDASPAVLTTLSAPSLTAKAQPVAAHKAAKPRKTYRTASRGHARDRAAAKRKHHRRSRRAKH
jgi:hypothetical protein